MLGLWSAVERALDATLGMLPPVLEIYVAWHPGDEEGSVGAGQVRGESAADDDRAALAGAAHAGDWRATANGLREGANLRFAASHRPSASLVALGLRRLSSGDALGEIR